MWLTRFVLLFAVAACGAGVSDNPNADSGAGDGDAVGSYAEESPGFQLTLCKVEATCFAKDEAECQRDVADDMAYAAELLDDAGEERCAACMHVKTREFQKVLDAACDLAAADEAALRMVCDLDPSDGVDKLDEACAGYP